MKKLITFLGTGDYKNTKYEFRDQVLGEKVQIETCFIQEALSEMLGDDIKVYIGLTDDARESNWKDSVKEKDGVKEESIGLETILKRNNINFQEFPINSGNNESEIWENFDRIFDIFEEKDEVYFDVTHSLRSLPIIMMSVLNYAKFVKHIIIKGIYYGAYDSRSQNNITSIIDLTVFDKITDWTVGAERFINTGDSRQLSEIMEETIHPILSESKGKDVTASRIRDIKTNLDNFSGSIYTVRGNKISTDGYKLKESLLELGELDILELKPLEKIIDLIYKKVENYSNNLVLDVFETVKLCNKLNLIQQGYTFLQENIINFLYEKCKDIIVEPRPSTYREDLKNTLLSKCEHKNIELNKLQNEYLKELEEYINKDIANFYINLGKDRNDLNHAEYVNNPTNKIEKFNDKLDGHIDVFENIIINEYYVQAYKG